MEVEYWSTLTTRGRGDVARVEEEEEVTSAVEMEKVCVALPFPGR